MISGEGGATVQEQQTIICSGNSMGNHSLNSYMQEAPFNSRLAVANSSLRATSIRPEMGGDVMEMEFRNWQCQSTQNCVGKMNLQKIPSISTPNDTNLTVRTTSMEQLTGTGAPVAGKAKNQCQLIEDTPRNPRNHEATSGVTHRVGPHDSKEGAQPADMNNTKTSEDQWQTQRRKNFKGSFQNTQKKQEKSKQVYKPIQTKAPGIDSTVPTCNIDTGVQDQCPNPLISIIDDAFKLQRNYEQKDTGYDQNLKDKQMQMLNTSQEINPVQAQIQHDGGDQILVYQSLIYVQNQNLGSDLDQALVLGSKQGQNVCVLDQRGVQNIQSLVKSLDTALNGNLLQQIGTDQGQMNQVQQPVAQHDTHEERVEKGYEQMQLQLLRTPTRTNDQAQASNSKSKNKLSKKRRDALKKRLEAQNREAQVNPTLMFEVNNNSSPAQGIDTQNNTIESHKSNISSQQSKCSSQQSKQDTPTAKGTQPFLVADQDSPRNPLFVDS
ncbi:hypothetical protein HAX54_007292 [Datura stramonium]|uniref:Uncharacterized protein n=1 Tax=Datura stramonium TaxID=4076 RepID=A0ABS8WUL8_DATST|nr:hypothetical protein [Datura stramonium]